MGPTARYIRRFFFRSIVGLLLTFEGVGFCLALVDAWSVADTVASAWLYSLVQRGKVNNLNPYANPRRVFTELPRVQSPADIEALLPTRPTPADLT